MPDVNVLFADEFGVWVTGLAPIHDAQGDVIAAVAADLPAIEGAAGEALGADARQSFASMLQTAAVRMSRAEIDAITDGLTGLYNHRYLHERLSEELARSREQEQPLSVLFCDLDHFKQFNDRNGHSAGDAALREVAHIIEQSMRSIDLAARYGGEEFVVVLVETARADALDVAERIRARLEQERSRRRRRAAHAQHRRRQLPRRRHAPRGAARQGRLGDVPRQAAGAQPRRAVRRRGMTPRPSTPTGGSPAPGPRSWRRLAPPTR